MTIAEVSSKYGLSPDTLRYYERIGLIPPVRRTAGGIRDYSENDCMWVSFAKCMRGAGLQVCLLYKSEEVKGGVRTVTKFEYGVKKNYFDCLKGIDTSKTVEVSITDVNLSLIHI